MLDVFSRMGVCFPQHTTGRDEGVERRGVREKVLKMYLKIVWGSKGSIQHHRPLVLTPVRATERRRADIEVSCWEFLTKNVVV